MERPAGLIMLLALVASVAGAAGCAVGIGYRIPGTPIGVGVSVPLDRFGQPADPRQRVVYRQVYVATAPQGARILVNGALVGSTPTEVSVPFPRGRWGRPAGSARLLVEMPGYLPEGTAPFPAREGVATRPDGPLRRELRFELRPDR